jgi:hypothetical protein
MKKSIQLFSIGLIITSFSFGQTFCPPAYVDALFFDEEVFLSWVQTNDFDTILYDECFEVCSLAVNAMTIEYAVDNGVGGWFRDSDGESFGCGEGMFPCDDGGDDSFSAHAVYTDSDTTAIDVRLITTSIDLTDKVSAYIEFIEGYNWVEDANDSNMVEVSTDGGATWDVVYSSIPWDIGDNDIWFNTIEISNYVGNEILVAFRYYDSVGYGEEWFVDEIRVSGSTASDYAGCGTFDHYGIYVDGVLTYETEDTWYTVPELENGSEYCFEVTAVYDEGESEPSSGVCATPMGPFQVNPLTLNFDELSMGEYQEMVVTIENFDTLGTDYDITSIELSNIEVAIDVLTDPMEGNYVSFTDPAGSFAGVWGIGDSAFASSTYLPFNAPDDGGDFAYVNDDDIGDGSDPTDAWLISDEIWVGGAYPSFLLFDLFFPNPDGLCSSGNLYSDDFLVHVTVDDGENWILVDSSAATGWWWASYMFNLAPHIGDAGVFKVAFQYHDCGGNWGYGVALDNISIKEGDDFTWITVSPYSGYADPIGNLNDSISVTVGVYGPYDEFTATDEILVSSDNFDLTVLVGVGVVVSVDNSGLTPFQFALHQNYPNPFNPETNIQFDVAEKSDVTVSIFNIMGQKVATLINGNLDAGVYHLTWNGLSDLGTALPSGMYFYEMRSPKFHSVKKLVLVK